MPPRKKNSNDFSATSFCVVDVETTGLSPTKNRVIEIGMVKVDGLKIIDKFHTMINPRVSIPYYITQFTGITNEDVIDSPCFSELQFNIKEFLGESVLVGHNLSFDNGFLQNEFRICGEDFYSEHSICTLRLARRIYPELPSKSLSSVAKHLKIKNTSAHRALSDAETTARILIKIIKQLKKNNQVKSLDDLSGIQNLPTKSRKLKVTKELADDISFLPNAPGIYYFLNNKNEIIYVGKAKSLRDRVRSYFLNNTPSKAKKIVRTAKRLKVEVTNTELTALLMEAELVKLINPKHNSQLKKYGNKYFLRVELNHKAPKLEIKNHFDFDGNDYFGLFISRKKAADVLDILDRTFALRECSDKEFARGKICFLHEIKRCTAPCIDDESNRESYKKEIEHVYDFLYGKNNVALDRLLKKMREYSETEKYEKASEVKEIIELILSQINRSSILAEPVNSANVMIEISGKFGKDYILFLCGKIFIKNYPVKTKNHFDEALTDYFEQTIRNDFLPDDEDLEKMKIALNWMVKNRNSVKVFYLNEFNTKDELFRKISSKGFTYNVPSPETFELSELMNH